MKKVLILASVASMISQFNMENIYILKELGFEVHVACNFNTRNNCDEKTIKNLKSTLRKEKVTFFQVDFTRDILNIPCNIKAYFQVKKILAENKYAFIHCHSPIGGVVGRLAGYREKIKVIYTAHGFHFYKGAPLKNWIFYFSAEWLCSYMTDLLITINKEDYSFAKKYLRAKKTVYVPGIGIDIKRFELPQSSELRKKKQIELGLNNEILTLLSVGELNKNKNHEVIIKALANMRDINYRYFICGEGVLRSYLQQLIEQYSLQDKVKLLGYRDDLKEVYQVSDVFVFPSKREGLSVALMEAMANKLPVVGSKIRGNVDLIQNGKGGFLVDETWDSSEFEEKIRRILSDKEMREQAGKINRETVSRFRLENVNKRMREIYKTYAIEQKTEGNFIISLDFELQYGMEDIPELEDYKRNIKRGKQAIIDILGMFEQYKIHATWAAVGMILAENREERAQFIPNKQPSYMNEKLSIYKHIEKIGKNEKEDPLHYGLLLTKRIQETFGQEIGTHTFCHYYCLEKGQTADEFEADLQSAICITEEKLGIPCRSLVLPRNQINPLYMNIMKTLGITSYRGCPHPSIYRTTSKNYIVRGLRFVDAYTGVFGHKCYPKKTINRGGICNISASSFLRPYNEKFRWLEPLKVRCIKRQMRYAAQNGLIFHLWWHPHNFGNYTEKNLGQLKEILAYYTILNHKYGFKSKNMSELAEEALS